MLEERNRSELQSFKDIGSLYDEQRLRIHEFKNQINFINGLIDKQDYDTLRTYVGKIKSDIDSEEKLIETGNSVINILINQSIRKASQKHIYITPNINIMQDIQLEDNDLVIIISNLINNAIEHCDTLKKSNKIINFKLESTDDHLLIVCTNPIETTIIVENNLIRTTKNNYAEHGFGLKNINRMVDKYDGDISISTDDNKFKYVIMIQYKEN
ncbi:MAG: ATP-binding protein [Clostridia bacterium]|nr:ATP-binding protein [Clostridia bacterium]